MIVFQNEDARAAPDGQNLRRRRHAGAAGFQGSQRQRTVGGRIQVADMARHLEQGALRRKHGDDLLVGTYLLWPISAASATSPLIMALMCYCRDDRSRLARD